jgi:PPK2 family polyphosphate:nucleotide phosphotransferase
MHIDRYRVRTRDANALRRCRSDDTGRFKQRAQALEHLAKGVDRLSHLQELLFAQDRYALLLIFQGMDASGKDGTIKHVMSGVNPRGTDVHQFGPPSADELQHDFLWRTTTVLPARGRIGIFNRSYYEEVLAVRVHRPLLENERLPPSLVTRDIWAERFEDIRAFERHLWRNGTIVRKFYLHISRAEQGRRLAERIDDPAKNWKFSERDVKERRKWNEYTQAYASALAETSRDEAPWYVVPADHKWFAHAVVAEVIVQTLESLPLAFPRVTVRQRRHLRSLRRALR